MTFSNEQILGRFNAVFNTCCHFSKGNFDRIEKALNNRFTTEQVYKAVDKYKEVCEADGTAPNLKTFLYNINLYVEEPEAPKAESTGSPVADAMAILQGAVIEMTKNVGTDAIKDRCYQLVDQYIAEQYGPIQRKMTLELNDAKRELEGVTHEKFDTVLSFVFANEPVFLTGRAGTGKNFLCKQVAQALNLDFYFTNAVTQEYKLTGFTDANGHYQESQFYKAFKNGGLFMLDEMDASIPEVLVILNAAIANRYFDFPAPIGYVEAHPDFRVIAAGNTFGLGADFNYVGRNQLDAASLDRFALVEIDYDERIEKSCAGGDEDWLGFCRAFRDAAEKAGIRTVVSYRAISRGHQMRAMLDAETVVKTCLVKSLSKGDLKNMSNGALQDSYGEYSRAFRKLEGAR